jgi:hypothetical protein
VLHGDENCIGGEGGPIALRAPEQEVSAIRKGQLQQLRNKRSTRSEKVKKCSESSERGSDVSSYASTCRAGDQASWILSVTWFRCSHARFI